jgi:hypothetical protein
MTYQYQISIDKHNQTIIVKGAGELGNKDAELMYTDAFALLREQGFYRMLLSNQHVRLLESPLSIMHFIDYMKDKKMFELVKVARVISLDSYCHEFVEQVADLKCVNIKNFEDCQSALQWLTSRDIKA